METQVAVTREQRKIMIEEISRAVPEYEEPSQDSERLAKKASRILGYRGLLTFNAGGKLQAILENLGIEALDPKAVFEYQAKFGRSEFMKTVVFLPDRVRLDDSDEDEEDEEEDTDDEEEVPRAVSRSRFYWARTPIAKYEKAIPEFVVSKAIQIKEALPSVEIFVEDLKNDPDPFLVVTCKNDNFVEQYYIEVWEEPEFEGRFLLENKDQPKKKLR